MKRHDSIKDMSTLQCTIPQTMRVGRPLSLSRSLSLSNNNNNNGLNLYSAFLDTQRRFTAKGGPR